MLILQNFEKHELFCENMNFLTKFCEQLVLHTWLEMEAEEESMDVEAILSAHQSKFKSTEVNKEVELQFDLGRLLATDLNEIEAESLKTKLILNQHSLLFNY